MEHPSSVSNSGRTVAAPEEMAMSDITTLGREKPIFLRNVGGIEPLCGIDAESRYWCEFCFDGRQSEHCSVPCSQCGRTIHNGWVCLHNGEYRCHEHVRY